MRSFKAKLVVYFALLALLPSAVAFYGYDTLAKRSETRRADARLQAVLRGALPAYAARLEAARRTARAAAEDQALQLALRRKDEAAVAAATARWPRVGVRAAARTRRRVGRR